MLDKTLSRRLVPRHMVEIASKPPSELLASDAAPPLTRNHPTKLRSRDDLYNLGFCRWTVTTFLKVSEHHRNFDDHVLLSSNGFALSYLN